MKDQLCKEILQSDCKKKPEIPRNFLIERPPRFQCVQSIVSAEKTGLFFQRPHHLLMKVNMTSSSNRIVGCNLAQTKAHLKVYPVHGLTQHINIIHNLTNDLLHIFALTYYSHDILLMQVINQIHSGKQHYQPCIL